MPPSDNHQNALYLFLSTLSFFLLAAAGLIFWQQYKIYQIRSDCQKQIQALTIYSPTSSGTDNLIPSTSKPKNSPCFDSDADKDLDDIYFQGYVSYVLDTGTSTIIYDQCTSDNTQVIENICFENPFGSGNYSPLDLTMKCSQVCQNGACVGGDSLQQPLLPN